MNKTHRRLMVCLALCGCGALGAATPGVADEVSPNAQALGIGESLLSYCTRVDAPHAATLETRVKQLSAGMSEETLAKVRKSDAYRQGYESVTDFVGKVDPHNAALPCSEALAAGK